MTLHGHDLPHTAGELFLTDAGLETMLIFHDGIDLPHFASIELMTTQAGRDKLTSYYDSFAEIAARSGTGLVVDTPTWRASSGWGELLGHDADELRELNLAAVRLVQAVRDDHDGDGTTIVISGSIGPKGDGYDPDHLLDAETAKAYHQTQIDTFAESRADMVSAATMTHTGEAIGIVLAAREAGVPVGIYFTVETDGKLPSGETLRDAIETVEAATDGYAAFFGINCAHPTHFASVLTGGGAWRERIQAVRANASTKSHAELDESTELDDGNPAEFGAQCIALRKALPHLTMLGGCCGTDQRHITAIAEARG